MAKKRTTEPTHPPNLVVPRAEAAQKIKARIEKGHEIRSLSINSEQDLERANAERSKWSKYNTELLTRLFDSASMAKEYDLFFGASVPIKTTFAWWVKDFREGMDGSITRLESISERLELIPELGEHAASSLSSRCIFIGHGRSKLWARLKIYLEDELRLPTITYESESRVGESIVPTLEKMLDQATFAVLVLTAEDETAEGSRRARQNVIHEAGLFQGRLGFKRAVMLKQEGLENFTNVEGLQYIGFSGDQIEQTFYDLQRVLKREGLLQ